MLQTARTPTQTEGKPWALDLYCGAGGVAVGLIQAGYQVVGIDHRQQPDYPGHFILADALHPPVDLNAFAFIWASPPCQAFTQAINRKTRSNSHPNLIPQTRELLSHHSHTCIENVDGAPLRPDLVLTLPMFANYTHPHKRIFELSFFTLHPTYQAMPGLSTVSTCGNAPPNPALRDRRRERGLPATISLEEITKALGIDHIRSGTKLNQRKALSQALPPVYSYYIGKAALEQIRKERSYDIQNA